MPMKMLRTRKSLRAEFGNKWRNYKIIAHDSGVETSLSIADGMVKYLGKSIFVTSDSEDTSWVHEVSDTITWYWASECFVSSKSAAYDDGVGAEALVDSLLEKVR